MKGTDFQIKLNPSDGKTYRDVQNQFLNTMNDIVDVMLGTVESFDYVRLAIKNSRGRQKPQYFLFLSRPN